MPILPEPANLTTIKIRLWPANGLFGRPFWRYSQIMLSAVLVLLTAAVVMQSEAAKIQPECAGPNHAPVVVQKADAEYSQDARKSRIEGTVVLTVEVGTDGGAHHIRVVRSLGHGLDEEAITAVAHWRFKPATRDGAYVPVRATIEVVFRLPLEPESERARVP